MRVFSVLCVLVLSSAISAVEVFVEGCGGPLKMGTTPCKAKPSIRYHLDAATQVCLAFEYTGCGGNGNNFESEHACYRQCLPIDHTSCPVASKPLPKPEICYEDKECGRKGYCSYGNGFGICCDKSIRDKVDADYNPKCPKGKSVYKVEEGGIKSVLIGKNCKSKFCPAGATCVEGTYHAACCK